MSAVRKLLLADDSITIQKIVALTFADAGIEVIAVDNGTDAVEKLWENAPDVVLADVFMPGLSGYEVCEHIKKTESLKHIPVMLLVGSFEPFDEAEARRVGADDILTKPFQSIRTLMDKVGTLLGRSATPSQPEPAPPAVAPVPVVPPTAQPDVEVREYKTSAEMRAADVDREAETKDLPPPEVIPPPEEPMTAEELEITTADTQPLSPEIRKALEHAESVRAQEKHSAALETTMQTTPPPESMSESAEGFGDALLDLGNPEPVIFVNDDDVVLDIDFDSGPQPYSAPVPAPTEVAVGASAESPAYASAYAAPVMADSYGHAVQSHEVVHMYSGGAPEFVDTAPEAAAHFVGSEGAAGAPVVHEAMPAATVVPAPQAPVMSSPGSQVSLDQLSPEVIDAIARRVIEQMSEKAVQEIAWEVVPQLADLMIKRKLEERETQNR